MESTSTLNRRLVGTVLSIVLLIEASGVTAAAAEEGYPDWPRESIVVSDGRTLYEIDVNDPNIVIPLNCPRDEFTMPNHPATAADANYVWFDAIDQRSNQPAHRRLWKMDLYGKRTVYNLSSDPYGNSYDITPIPAVGSSYLLFQSNRSGSNGWTTTATGKQGSGYGNWLGNANAAAWALVGEDKLVAAYLAYDDGLVLRYITQDVSQEISWGDVLPFPFHPIRLSVSPDGQSILVSTPSAIYLKFLPDGELVGLLANATDGCFDASGGRIAYTAVPEHEVDSEVFVSHIVNGHVVDSSRLTYNVYDDHYPAWVQRKAGEAATKDNSVSIP